MNPFKEKYALVVGLGRSGLAMAKFLACKGEKVIATDINSLNSDLEKELNDIGIETQFGFHKHETFDNAQKIIPSPGIPLTSNYIAQALKKGIPVTGELDIFTQYNDKPVLAITGTNGKTTVTTLISDMLKADGYKVFTGGNIGVPAIQSLLDDIEYDIIVAEVSSFQLDISSHFKPEIALLINTSEDHLDRYENYNEYIQSKWSIFNNQSQKDFSIINSNIKGLPEKIAKLDSNVLLYPKTDILLYNQGADIKNKAIQINLNSLRSEINVTSPELKGDHNIENVAAASLACIAFGASIKGIKQGIQNFKNIAHRLEYTDSINNITFVNDSKATNTDAVVRALECFERNIILILGGKEKDTDFSLLNKAIEKSVKTIIAIGETKEKIVNALSSICPILIADSMKEAVKKAYEIAGDKGIVLLSPACASFDMYDNYNERGDDFKACVKELKEIYG